VEQEGSGRTVAPERALRERVVTTLRSEPEWSNADITVDVRGTCVWLTGSVDTINAKYQVEQSVKRVRGVESIVNDLIIRVGNALEEFSRNTDAARLREQLRRAP
jgi:osmotically-inducible protein OsmY